MRLKADFVISAFGSELQDESGEGGGGAGRRGDVKAEFDRCKA